MKGGQLLNVWGYYTSPENAQGALRRELAAVAWLHARRPRNDQERANWELGRIAARFLIGLLDDVEALRHA